MTDTHTQDAAKTKAEASFKRKEQQARDGAIAMTEYLSAQTAERAKMAKLRALRLAKEAQEAHEAQEPGAAPKPKARAKRKTAAH
jgi:hypothetical protein